MAGARGPRFWTTILVIIILSGAAVYAMFSSGFVANLLNMSNQATTSNPNAREGLSFNSYNINSATNTTVGLQNIGTVAIGFTTYILEDNRSDVYTFHYNSQPVINPGASIQLNILIGSSCGGCVLSGNPFTYTVWDRAILVTARNNQFTTAV